MRIAFVVSTLNIGGQERLVVRMAHLLRDRGHDVHVVTLSAGGMLRSELGSIPVHSVVRRPGYDPMLHVRLFRLFRELRPDVVHTHNAAPLIYGAPAARLARVRRVLQTKHGEYRYGARELHLARAVSRWCVDHFVAVSAKTAAAAAGAERPPGSTLCVIENGIPLGDFEPDPEIRTAVRDELGLPRDAKVIGAVGRLVDEKDYPLLVRAAGPLLSENARLVFVGDGPARGRIEAAVDPRWRDFVSFTGVRHDVQRIFRAFDVFASSSATEGLPLALLEAMTTALPVVATAVGGVPDVVPPDAGILVPHGEPEALRAGIERLLSDERTRARMGDAARSYATERFGEHHMMRKYLALYAS